jgi:hypothetical protein
MKKVFKSNGSIEERFEDSDRKKLNSFDYLFSPSRDFIWNSSALSNTVSNTLEYVYTISTTNTD